MDSRRVAVIDLGSNSFKLLVAQGAQLTRVFEAYEDVRLLEKHEEGNISQEKFALGIAAVKRLFERAREYVPSATAIVGTSVFRTMGNARAFSDAVFEATGIPLTVLSGEEEAEGIAAGVATDSLVHALPRAPAIFDLGGGSLEFISDGGKNVRSWQLGAVRLMREFVRESEAALPQETIQRIRKRVRETLGATLKKHVHAETPIVFCGGVLAITHRILAEKSKVDPALFPRKMPLLRIDVLLDHLAMRTARERAELDGVPAARADIFPVALAVVLEVAEVCGAEELIFSPKNLRYGIAAKLIAGLRP